MRPVSAPESEPAGQRPARCPARLLESGTVRPVREKAVRDPLPQCAPLPRTRLLPNGAGNVGRRGRAAGHANGPRGRPCEVTTGSQPSAWLPCGSRGLFQQQLIDGQSGHDRSKSGHDYGQSNPENHGQELPGRHAQRPGISVPGRPAAAELAQSVPGPCGGQACWLGLAGWFELGDARRCVHHLPAGLGRVRVLYGQLKAHHLGPEIGGCRGALRREGEDHRTLHGLGHSGLPQRHHLHRHRADERSSFFSFRFPYRPVSA
jgi:hypothetical protein